MPISLTIQAETVEELFTLLVNAAEETGVKISPALKDAQYRAEVLSSPNLVAVDSDKPAKRGRGKTAAHAEPPVPIAPPGETAMGSASDAGKGTASSIPPSASASAPGGAMAAAPSEPASFSPFDQTAEPVVTLDMVLEIGKAFVGKHGIAPLQPIFAKFNLHGADASFKKMDAALYPAIYKEMKAILG